MTAFFAIAAFVLAWVALVHVGKKQGWKGFMQHLVGFTGGLLSMVIVIVAMVPKPAEAPAEAASAEQGEVVAPPGAEMPTLGVTVEQYVANFNAVAAQLKIDDRVDVPSIESGMVNDTAKIALDEHRFIVLGIAKGTGQVKDVTFMGAGDGSTRSTANLLTGSLATLSAAFEESKRTEVGPVIGELMKSVKPDADSVKRSVAGREVWMGLSSMIGFSAGVQVPDAANAD